MRLIKKKRGIRLIIDGKNLEEPNPDFCQPYRTSDNKSRWQGYGIKSIATFLQDVNDIYKCKITLGSLVGNRPTFEEAVISTAVVETAGKSLAANGNWKSVEGL